MHKQSSLKLKNVSQTVKLVGLLLVVGGFFVAIFLSQTIQEIRQQADVVKGSSSIKLVPGTSSLAIGQPTQIQLVANIQQGIRIDGIQVIGEFAGNLPANLAFTPTRPAGFNQDPNESIARLVTSGANKKLELIYITPRSTTTIPPYTTTGQDLVLGTFNFTPTAAGQMTFTFNTTLTKVLETGTSTNLFGSGTSSTINAYQFVTASPSPSASASPTNSPTPTPGVSASPTASPTPTPTATPGTGGGTSVIDFNSATAGAPLNGQYPSGIANWGTGTWYVSPAWGQFTTNSISYSNATIRSGVVSFLSPVRLVSIEAYNGGSARSDITISCPGSNIGTFVNAGSFLKINATNWGSPCSTITITSSNGWETNFDNLTYTTSTTATASPTASPTPTPSNSPTPTPTRTPTPSPSPTPSNTPTPTPTRTPTPSPSPTPSNTPTPTPTRTPTPSPSPTPSNTPTPTPIACLFSQPEVSITPNSQSGTPGQTRTYTVTVRNTNTGTCSNQNYLIESFPPDYPPAPGVTSKWTTQDSPSTLTIANGASSSITTSITPNTSVVPGSYNFDVMVYDSQSAPVKTTATYIVSSTPTSSPAVCEGDINGDLMVEISDYSILVRNFLKNPVPEPEADLNKDGDVDISDYSILARNFLRDCTAQ